MNHIENIRLHDLELERRRRACGIIAGLAIALAMWAGIIAAVVALT